MNNINSTAKAEKIDLFIDLEYGVSENFIKIYIEEQNINYDIEIGIK